MTRRGLTLVEMLLALVLLGAVTAAAAAWTALAARATVEHAAPDAWRSAAEATLRLIHDDIATGDLGDDDSENNAKQPKRVQVIDGTLTIRTREGGAGIGPAVHVYRYDAVAHRLYLVSQDGRDSRLPPRLLLDEVEAFECGVNAEHGVVLVTIRRFTDDSPAAVISRRFSLP